jgi:hypothetical protein
MQKANALKQSTDNICIYCGKSNKMTVDHIPPKGIFSSPRPSNLITVPCCDKCNLSYSKDDEYLRINLTLRLKSYTHQHAKNNWPNIVRGLNRKERPGLKNSIIRNLVTVDATTETGLYIGKMIGIEVDMNRVYRVIKRIMKGLYFFHNHHTLPANVELLVKEVTDKASHKSIPPIHYTELYSNKRHDYGEGAFWYRISLLEENDILGSIICSFYNDALFYGVYKKHNRNPE